VTQNSILKLNQQLAIHQKLLADHVIARYKMGEYQALKWILNQDDPYKINRLLTYYQYIIQSRKHLIDKIDETRKNLEKSNKKLQSELVTNQNLNSQLIQHQQQLQQNKNYNTSILKDLNSEIQNNQQNLIDVQRNKNSLTLLLKSLIQQSKVQNSEPFSRMRKKLPFPVQSKSRAYSKMNQGVTIFADEGEVVTAIYPGKIVFSDWLKGYGLLLIIDHGQGFMSLYAHNQSLFKRKGQTVRQNEQVASVGHSGGMSQNGLYFEIRQRGKAIPPLEWLS
jgi:septal ring factor EnvC (AmiA/AmiB activator)